MEAGNSPEVTLRPFLTDDIPRLLQWFADASDEDILFWSGGRFTAPLDRYQLEKFLEERFVKGLTYFYAIEEDSRMIGAIALLRIDRENHMGRIGFVLVGEQKQRNRGVAGKAVALVLGIGFEQEQLHKVTLGVFENNYPAIQCYTKLGFRREGVLRDHRYLNGRYYNLVEMSILKSEWMLRRKGDPFCLASRRLLLKQFSETEAEKTCDFYRRNRAFHAPWAPLREESFYTVEMQRRIVLREQEHARQGSMFRFWLVAREGVEGVPDGTVLGNVSLSNIIYGYFHSAFLGYQMDKDHVRRGFAHEALVQILKFAFETVRLHRLEANIVPENTASRALAKKLGFREEGLARRYLQIAGSWKDHIHYVLLQEEWAGKEEESG